MKFILILLNIYLTIGYIIPDVIPSYNTSLINIIESNNLQEQNITIQKIYNITIDNYMMIIKTDNCINQTRYYKKVFKETNLSQITFYDNCKIIAKIKFHRY